jgi:thioredoxin-like negative regulator of GroEL
VEETITWLQARAEAGDTDALRRVARLLEEAGRVEEAITWLQACAEAGDTHALGRAAELLEKAGRTDEMQRLRQYGIEPGGSIAERWACGRGK